MALNQTTRKKLLQALQQSGRIKVTDEQVEAAALAFIDGKKTMDELAEKLGVTSQTLRQRMKQLAEPAVDNGVAEPAAKGAH